MIPYNHSSIVRKLSEYILRRGESGYVWIQGPYGVGKSYIVRQAIKSSCPTLTRDLIFTFNTSKLDEFIQYFTEELGRLAHKSQHNLLDRISKSVPEMPKSTLLPLKNNKNNKSISETLRLLYDTKSPLDSLKWLFQTSNQLLIDNNLKLPIGIKLASNLDASLFECLVKNLPNTNIIPIIMCNEMNTVLYFYKNLLSLNSYVLDVQEPEEDFIRNYIKSNVTSFTEILEAILLVAGHNLALINRISEHLREANYPATTNDYSDEFYPFGKSKEERLSYELLECQKSCIINLPETVLKEDITAFNSKISNFLSFPPIEKMKSEMKNDLHFKVTTFETIRYIMGKRIMQSYNNNYQKNPIIMGLIYSDLLFYYISLGKFVVNNLTKRLILDYINSEYQSLSGGEMIEYNLNYLLNFKIIQKQVDLAL